MNKHRTFPLAASPQRYSRGSIYIYGKEDRYAPAAIVKVFYFKSDWDDIHTERIANAYIWLWLCFYIQLWKETGLKIYIKCWQNAVHSKIVFEMNNCRKAIIIVYKHNTSPRNAYNYLRTQSNWKYKTFLIAARAQRSSFPYIYTDHREYRCAPARNIFFFIEYVWWCDQFACVLLMCIFIYIIHCCESKAS